GLVMIWAWPRQNSRPELQILEMLAGRGMISLGEEAHWFLAEARKVRFYVAGRRIASLG
ncbi:hypothetical protein A2U01_0068551, partial [Trifolium medium]|nr:hypothetical protein [Trifolium medium]